MPYVSMQVVQKSGHVIGSCELSVVSDIVDVSRLDVAVVSGLSLSVSAKADFPGALSVHVTKTNLMHHRYQVAKHVFQCRLKSASELKFLLVISYHCYHYGLSLLELKHM